MDCSKAKCYSHDQDSYSCPHDHIPLALTNWANSPPPGELLESRPPIHQDAPQPPVAHTTKEHLRRRCRPTIGVVEAINGNSWSITALNNTCISSLYITYIQTLLNGDMEWSYVPKATGLLEPFVQTITPCACVKQRHHLTLYDQTGNWHINAMACVTFFTKVKQENILAFLRVVGLYHLI